MTDHQQAAIDAAAISLRQIEPNLYQNPANPQRYYGGLAQDVLAAAEPHLRKKCAEEEAAKLAKTTVGLAAILDRFLENAEWESSGEEMAQKIIESVQNGLLKGAGE